MHHLQTVWLFNNPTFLVHYSYSWMLFFCLFLIEYLLFFQLMWHTTKLGFVNQLA